MATDTTNTSGKNTTKIEVNDMCIGCGLCASGAPSIFEMKDGVSIVKKTGPYTEEEIKNAKKAESDCPVAAITVEE